MPHIGESVPTADPQVVNNTSEGQYELWVNDGRIGLATYTIDGDVMTMPHTVVDPASEGKGYGSQLVKAALDDARARHLRVVPACPFVDAYIRRHKDYADLVDA